MSGGEPIRKITLEQDPARLLLEDAVPVVRLEPMSPPEVIVVPVGPAGGKGDKGDSPAYQHTQGSAATVWTVNHNLGFRPAVAVHSPGGLEVEAEVLHVSPNQCVITFATPQSGFARFV